VNIPRFGRRRARTRAVRTDTTSRLDTDAVFAEPVALEEILVTYKLRSRRRRKPNSYQENQALYTLARTMASSPEKLIDTLLQIAVDLCCAGSAGLSLLEADPEGQQVFRWTNLAGELKDYVGGTTPRNFSPCGTTLDLNAPQLFDRPQRRFQYLGKVNVDMGEALVIPIYLGDRTPGTIWIVAHDEECKFDSEDVRLLTGLAEFTAGALRLTHAYESERRAREDAAVQIDGHKQNEESLKRSQVTLEAMVQSRTAQLRQLSSRLMALQDEERRRIARELHDSAGQYLAGIQMNLHALNQDKDGLSEKQAQRVSDSLIMADLCNSEIRTISYLLHPPLLDEVGLASAISWYVEGFSQRSGIRVGLEIQDELGRLPQDVENALFRVVQQSLANIHRHSGSEVAQIRINVDAEQLVAEICDEGRGIPQEMLKGFHEGTRLVGVGMAGMRERVRDMGGYFDIRSSENGTTIEVRLPLPANALSASA
jgi:signal transduction histidine kinase